MRKLKEIARLRFDAGRTLQEIAGSVGVSRSTVQLTLQRMTAAGLSWPWPEPKGQFTTDAEHRPAGHQAVIELRHERLLQRAEAIGEATVAVIRGQAERRKHRDETLRTSLGILRLAKDFSPEALEVACRRALRHRTLSYSAVLALLKAPPVQPALSIPAIEHGNLRGPGYYAEPSSC